MGVQCMSVVVGNKACNAKCPFCVSKQTGGFEQLSRGRKRRINFLNLEEACVICGTARTPTLLLTGKGEPTLFPNEITEYLEWFRDRPFAPKELQTNGLGIGRLAATGRSGIAGLDEETLRHWRSLRLGVMALSTVGIHDAANAEVYHPDYPSLEDTIAYLRGFGFTIRLCVMMMRGDGCVADINDLKEVVEFCRTHDVGQLTARPITAADNGNESRAAQFVRDHGVSPDAPRLLYEAVEARAQALYPLVHGAMVFDWNGQNVCLSNCLTSDLQSAPGDHRSLIVFANGMVTTSWDHAEAAALLQGDPNFG